jgi:prolyl-tRNA synthetase
VLRPATIAEIEAVGAVPGYASPIGINRSKAIVVADELLTREAGLVAGANEIGFHLLNTLHGRDYQADIVAPIAAAFDGAPCATCGAPLREVRGVEVGNIFQLGTRYSQSLGASYTDERGQPQPIVMGSYGIGLGRVLACIAEEHHDDKGLCWPMSVAPFQVMLISMVKSAENKAIAEQLYADLWAAGVEVLLDDRDVSPGVKFGDADLIGLPIRLTVSERSLKNGGVEFKLRRGEGSEVVPLSKVIDETQIAIAKH